MSGSSLCIAVLVALSVVSSGFSSFRHVKKEQMIARAKFHKLRKSPPDHMHEVVIAVKQNNLDRIESMLLERSSPASQLYQKWMTFDEIGELIVNPEALEKVNQWLDHPDIKVTWKSPRSEYIKAVAPISVWEDRLLAEFHEWQDVQDKKEPQTHHLCEEYSLPETLDPHVTAIFYTSQVPPIITHHGQTRFSKKDMPFKSKVTIHDKKNALLRGSRGEKVSAEAVTSVTVSYLDTYYKIGSNTGSSSHQQSVFETNQQYFSPNDLTTFQDYFGLPVQSAVVVNGFSTSSCSVTGGTPNCHEGNLDIQYIMGMSQNTVTMYWYVGGSNQFVTWITDVASETNPPQVNSISWASVEQANAASTLSSFNTEALKLATMGVTITVGTGDNGVMNFGCPCDPAAAYNVNTNCACLVDSGSSSVGWSTPNSWSGKGYFPSFPATCPYVTAVGATMGSNGDPAQYGEQEIACQSQLGGVITTGGGFSTYYERPSWQNDAVADYFSQVTPVPGYNPMGRGIPDISLVGVAYEIVIGNFLVFVYGTSASAPVMAALVSLVNAEREQANLTSIGFINPTLYYKNYSSYYNDVISGINSCCASPNEDTCCSSGFRASPGWDPVTGWGSIEFPQFAVMFNTSAPYITGNSSNSSGYVPKGSSNSTLSVLAIALIVIAVILFVLLPVACALSAVLYYFGRAVCHRSPSAGVESVVVVQGQPESAIPSMVVIYPQQSHYQPAANSAPGTLWSCPDCTLENSPDARICAACGRSNDEVQDAL